MCNLWGEPTANHVGAKTVAMTVFIPLVKSTNQEGALQGAQFEIYLFKVIESVKMFL